MSSSSGTAINYGAQELFIQQLKDEIERITRLNHQLQHKAREQHHQLQRAQQHTALVMPIGELADDEENAHEWRARLRVASKYITQLIGEKEHLIEMSNSLRGQLNKIKCKSCCIRLSHACS